MMNKMRRLPRVLVGAAMLEFTLDERVENGLADVESSPAKCPISGR
jgi:hypothetical protein